MYIITLNEQNLTPKQKYRPQIVHNLGSQLKRSRGSELYILSIDYHILIPI